MRLRTGWPLLICCAVLAACTASGPKGPAATVTAPAVGRPPAPASVAAAMGSEAFTAYAALGAADKQIASFPGDHYGFAVGTQERSGAPAALAAITDWLRARFPA